MEFLITIVLIGLAIALLPYILAGVMLTVGVVAAIGLVLGTFIKHLISPRT